MTEAWRVGLAMFNGCCYLCNEPLYTETGETVSNVVIHADHIIPHNLGGTGSPGNLLAAHSTCNTNRGNTSIEEFFKNNPQQLKKVKDFQELYNYNPIDISVYNQIKEIVLEEFNITKNRIRGL
jgi:hypothetical protein